MFRWIRAIWNFFGGIFNRQAEKMERDPDAIGGIFAKSISRRSRQLLDNEDAVTQLRVEWDRAGKVLKTAAADLQDKEADLAAAFGACGERAKEIRGEQARKGVTDKTMVDAAIQADEMFITLMAAYQDAKTTAEATRNTFTVAKEAFEVLDGSYKEVTAAAGEAVREIGKLRTEQISAVANARIGQTLATAQRIKDSVKFGLPDDPELQRARDAADFLKQKPQAMKDIYGGGKEQQEARARLDKFKATAKARMQSQDLLRELGIGTTTTETAAAATEAPATSTTTATDTAKPLQG